MFSSNRNDIYLTFSKLFVGPVNLGNVKEGYVIIRMIHMTNKIPKMFFYLIPKTEYLFNINNW